MSGQLLLSASSIKIFGKAQKPSFKGKIFQYHQRRAHDGESLYERECYLLHHPVVNPKKPGKVRRALNGASKFHDASFNKSLLTVHDLL